MEERNYEFRSHLVEYYGKEKYNGDLTCLKSLMRIPIKMNSAYLFITKKWNQ